MGYYQSDATRPKGVCRGGDEPAQVIPLEEVSKVNPESWYKMNSALDVTYVDLANTKRGEIEST